MVTSDGEVRVQVNKQRRFVFVEDSNEWTQNLSVVLPKGPCREDTSRALDSMAVETLIWLPSNVLELDIVSKILDVVLDPSVCFGLIGSDSSEVVVGKAQLTSMLEPLRASRASLFGS
ncbi:hypothetical protein WN944_024207 [Citrus x changshan-huyou]|uniref:Uncharacterized protein n=1 Tax=Citrus x changshan-huyou TaxID=2935761 RepID=A0AAP0QCD6_9ROSI